MNEAVIDLDSFFTITEEYNLNGEHIFHVHRYNRAQKKASVLQNFI